MPALATWSDSVPAQLQFSVVDATKIYPWYWQHGTRSFGLISVFHWLHRANQWSGFELPDKNGKFWSSDQRLKICSGTGNTSFSGCHWRITCLAEISGALILLSVHLISVWKLRIHCNLSSANHQFTRRLSTTYIWALQMPRLALNQLWWNGEYKQASWLPQIIEFP